MLRAVSKLDVPNQRALTSFGEHALLGSIGRNTHMDSAPTLESIDIEHVEVPPGDPGEQVIANLILSAMASDMNVHAVARKHLAQAQLLAMQLADRALVYHPPRTSLFARLTCELDGHAETILMPVINNTLVLPASGAQGIVGSGQTSAPAVNVTALEITRYRLRLRPRRIATILESLDALGSLSQRTDAVRRILIACTRQEVPFNDPLDRANDFFSLARNLIGKRNLPLASLALGGADRALHAFAQTAEGRDQAASVVQMKEQIKRMLGELRRSAM
jgi:hypothetical protein